MTIIIITTIFLNCPWYSVPKGGEIKQKQLIKAASMTTCSRFIALVKTLMKYNCVVSLQKYGKPLKKKKPSLVSPETPVIFRPMLAKNSPADELIAPSVSYAIGWNMYAAERLQDLMIFLVSSNSATAPADLADALI